MAGPVPRWARRDARGACEHLEAGSDRFWRRFHPGQRTFDYLCRACAETGGGGGPEHEARAPETAPAPALAPAPAPALAPVTAELVEGLEGGAYWEGVIGFPEPDDTPDQLTVLRHQLDLRIDAVRAVVPVVEGDGERWILATDDALVELDTATGSARRITGLADVLPEALPGAEDEPESAWEAVFGTEAGDLVLAADRAGRYVAVAPAGGRYGVVVETATGAVAMELDRGDYHEDVCRFPLAFAEVSGRTVLLHATDWNRMDCSDPATGACLTERGTPEYSEESGPGAHYLDYFFCGLTVSPGGRRVVSDGWCWQPFGLLAIWDLDAWLHDNPWESEDGPSRRTVEFRPSVWDSPLVWLDDDRLAVWGMESSRDDMPRPGVRLYDVATGEELDWFPAARAAFATDGTLLYALGPGLTVYDTATGRRLLTAPALTTHARHPGTGRLLVVDEEGAVGLLEVAPGRGVGAGGD
ncbi:hypothetical protein ABT160_41020 [Streptomyces sp. NPDC001941]|uniref:hypothetical protein n=1 Tax=Streptomyces sp. NPDC001941 TaxID=3154659 RepID=UPI003334123E